MMESKKKRNICGGLLMPPVNSTDDVEMVRLGLRPPAIRPVKREPLTGSDKFRLKEAKRKAGPLSKQVYSGNKYSSLYKGKLIVYLENTKKLSKFKTTESYECCKYEVPEILSRISESATVKKAYFNNKPVK